MDFAVVFLRLIHIACGVFWAGTMIFIATFLEPSIREAGPNGGSVMQGLMRRKYLNVMPAIALLTVLSGIDLMRRLSDNFTPSWFSTANGMTLTIGAISAIVALSIGVGVMRPAVLKVGQLVQEAAATEDQAVKDANAAQAGALRTRSRIAGRWVAVLLTVAVAAMAVARYLG